MQDAAASSERAGNAPMAAQGCTNALGLKVGTAMQAPGGDISLTSCVLFAAQHFQLCG